jgi:tetratricopeptide (TPR) repeat protein
LKKILRFSSVLLLILLSVAIGAGIIYFILNTNTRIRNRDARVDELLADADYEVSLGYYEKALNSLEQALSRARGEYNTLRILKRVYIISYDLNDFFILNRFAKTASGNIPGSADLDRIYLYSAIRSETSERALNMLSKHRGNLQYLQAEAYLSGILNRLPDQDQEPELKRILSISAERDPYQLQRLGTELNEPRIHLDAALLWMEKGDPENAFALVNRHVENPLFREPSIYISYDAGHEKTSLVHLESLNKSADRADLLIMEADLNFLLDRKDEALRLYQNAIASHPRYDWTPYLNVALIAEQNGDRQTAHHFKQKAYQLFPDVGEVVLSYARSLSGIAADRRQAVNVLQNYLHKREEDYEAQALLLDLQNTASSPMVYQAALWKLYNQHPESRLLCEQLFLYLLEFNDLSGADSVLRHYQLATSRTQEPWLLDYRAILAAARQDYGAAIEIFKDRLAREESWQARFNLGMLLATVKQPEQAIVELIEAENVLTSQARTEEDRQIYFQSRIRSRIGEQYLSLGDTAAARRECEYAIDLDVSNFHAHRILRILEGD